MKKNISIVVILIIVSSLFSIKIPKLKGRINDYANMLNSNEERALEKLLFDAELSSSNQIAVLTVKSLQGTSIEDFSIRVAENWKLGQKNLDNGVLILVSERDKEMRIEVGYGLEATITDLIASYVIRENMIPHFRNGNPYQGLKEGLTIVTGLIKNEYVISDKKLNNYKKKQSRRRKGRSPIGTIIFLIIIASIFGKRGRRGILPWLILSSLTGSGRDSGGFSGGGGFGGFSGGGGGFGGGGASGGW